MGRGGVRVLVATVYYVIFKSDYLLEKKKAIRITMMFDYQTRVTTDEARKIGEWGTV